MRNKWTKRLFPVIALLLLAPWPVAYAYTYDGGGVRAGEVLIESAEVASAPGINAVGNTIGGVEPGTLFYVDATGTTADARVSLYLTNSPELVHGYRYIILKVGIYVETGDGQWQPATDSSGQPLQETFITLRQAETSFTLPGYAAYKITIDSGSYYCTTATGSLSPQFYLTVD